MCCSEPPPPPNMGDLAESSEEVARIAQQTQREQLDWAREQWGQQQEVLERVLGVQMDAMAENQAWARDDRSRYHDVFQPIEDDLIEDFTTYDSVERQESEAGKAVADVRNQFQAQRNNAEQRLASMGIDPSQVRSSSIDSQSRLTEALGSASAANTRRENVRDKGRALRADAINIGRGMPSQAAQSYGLALQAGSSGLQGMNSTMQSNSNMVNGAGQWGNQALQGYGQSGSLQDMQWQNQNTVAQQSNQMMGDIMGAGMGAFAMMSSKKTKKNIKAIPDKDSLKQVKDGKTYEYEYKDGYGQPSGTQVGTIAEQEHPSMRGTVNSPKGKQMGIDLNAKVARLEGAIREMSKKFADGGPVTAEAETKTAFTKRHNRAKALTGFGKGSMSAAMGRMIQLSEMLNEPDEPATPPVFAQADMDAEVAAANDQGYHDGGPVQMQPQPVFQPEIGQRPPIRTLRPSMPRAPRPQPQPQPPQSMAMDVMPRQGMSRAVTPYQQPQPMPPQRTGMGMDVMPRTPYGMSDPTRLFSDGGEVDGAGGPKEDAIPARLSDGEYVIPAAVVTRKGTDFFDKLLEQKGDPTQAIKAKTRHAGRDEMIAEMENPQPQPQAGPQHGVPLGGNRYAI